MRTARPLDSRLPEILEGISAPRTPDYFDDILGQVGRTRQRPGWTFPERWLPMTALSERVATAPRIPMRLAVGLALLLLALAVSVVLIAGSQRPSVPAPFGVAANGLVVFVDDTGSVLAGNIDDGTTRVIVPGPGNTSPAFSPDGRSLAYLHRSGGRTEIVVSGAQGESARVVNTTPIGNIGHLFWAPDSKSVIAPIGADLIAFDAATPGEPRVVFSVPDGAPEGWLDNLNANVADAFRPPNGDEILFVGSGREGTGLYRQKLAGGDPIAVVTDATVDSVWEENLSGAQWSPDGSQIVLTIHPKATPLFGYAYIVNADGSGLRRVSTFESRGGGGVVDEEHTAWSPDGTRIAFGRWITYPDGASDPRPIVIVDLASGEEREASNREVNGYHSWSWSPDGTSILQVPGEGSLDAGKVIEVDAATGRSRQIGWTSAGAASWQRTVPKS
jgi:Tol biopolymer transport system component